MKKRIAVAVFASGGGTNFQALLDRQTEECAGRITLLISDRPGAGAIERAQKAGIEHRIIPVKGRSLETVGKETMDLLEAFKVKVIILAGYLRLIPPAVVKAYPRRILNIHPALLPGFGGMGMWGRHVHEAVLASGATLSGPTVHFVDEKYDTGTIFAQWPVPVLADDTPETLAARVLKVEHILFPLAAERLCRAVQQGTTPERFHPPGHAFKVAARFRPGDLARQIQNSLGLP